MNTALWWLIQNTITVAVMIPFVLLACRVYRHRPAVQHGLWLIVLLKFVTPPLLAWPLSVEEMRAVVETPASVAAEEAKPPANNSIVERREQERPATPLLIPQKATMVDLAPTPHESELAEGHTTPPAEDSVDLKPYLLSGILCLWLAGSALCAIRQSRRIIRHLSLIRGSHPATESLTAEVKATALHLGVRPPKAVMTRGILSPFVWCFGPLRLIWPESLPIMRARGVLAHELAHLRRGDHWVAWLELLAALAWWWNPLFWFVRARLRETAEMACDALAIAAFPERRCEYAELLLELSAGCESGAPAPVLAVSAGTPASFERRFSMILSDRVSGKMSWSGFLTAVALALFTLPGWSWGEQRSKKPAEDYSPTFVREDIDTKPIFKVTSVECLHTSSNKHELTLKMCASCHVPVVQGAKSDLRENETPEERVKQLQKEIEKLRAMLAELEKQLKSGTTTKEPPAKTQVMKTITLKRANASELGKVLQELFKGKDNKGTRITADPHTNSLIVQGSTEDVEVIMVIVQKLDGDQTPSKVPVPLTPLVKPLTTPEAVKPALPALPAKAALPGLEGIGLNTLDLAERYLKAVADAKLARTRIARIKKEGGPNAEKHIEEAVIELERAERQEKIVTAFVKDAVAAAVDAMAGAKNELARAQELVKIGAMSASELEAVKRRLSQAESRYKQLEAILSTK